MRAITREELAALRATWEGHRIRLLSVGDPHTTLRPGAMGTVKRVDSMGTLHTEWDNGSTLGLVPGVDEWMMVR